MSKTFSRWLVIDADGLTYNVYESRKEARRVAREIGGKVVDRSQTRSELTEPTSEEN